jgi:hypothetical protein
VSPEIRNKKFAVIPANPRESGGIQEIQGKLDYRFRGNDERETPIYSVNF